MALIFCSGCTSEEIFQAAQIKGTFRLKSPTAMNGKFIIEEAYLKLSHINAIGSHQGANNTNLMHPIPAEEPPYQLSRVDSNQVIFNLPSRTYDKLDFHLFLFQDTYQLIVKEETGGGSDPKDGGDKDSDDEDDHDEDDEDDDEEEEDEDDEDDDGRMSENKKKRTVDIDHFFQHAKPSMVISGTYRNNTKILKLLFIVDGLDKIILTGKQNGSSTINFNKQNLAKVTFNPQYWFDSLKPSDLESASIQTYRGEQVVFIHKDFNKRLFKALASKLEGSAELNLTALSDGGF